MRTLLLFLLAAVTSAWAVEVGDPAVPLAHVAWVKGEPLKLGGSIVVVEIWATWCPPCLESIPHLTKLQRRYRDQVRIVGLSDEERPLVNEFVAKMGAGMDYRVGLINEAEVVAWITQEGSRPTAFLIDVGGTVVWRGHPMDLDRPLANLVTGTFDRELESKLTAIKKRLHAAVSGQQPDLPTALAATAEILALRPTDAQAINLRLAISKFAEKRDLYQTTMANVPIDQLDADTLADLAGNQLTQPDLSWRDIGRTVAFASKAHALAPDDAAITDVWARTLAAVGLIDQAIAAEEQAIAQAAAAKLPGDTYAANLAYLRAVKAAAAQLSAPAEPKAATTP